MLTPPTLTIDSCVFNPVTGHRKLNIFGRSWTDLGRKLKHLAGGNEMEPQTLVLTSGLHFQAHGIIRKSCFLFLRLSAA